MYSLQQRYSTVYEPYDQSRQLRVEIKYAGNWYDISSHVARAEVVHDIELDGSVAADKMVLVLHNESGQFDPAKVTDVFDPSQNKFNPMTLAGVPFLMTHIPVYAYVLKGSQSIEIFRGYIVNMNVKGTQTQATVYDIFYTMTLKKPFRAIPVTPNTNVPQVILSLLQDGLKDAIDDFNNKPPLQFRMNETAMSGYTMSTKYLFAVEPGESYLQLFSEALAHMNGLATYVPQLQEVKVLIPSEITYSPINSPATQYHIGESAVKDFSISIDESKPNKLIVKAPGYEISPNETECWTFSAYNNQNPTDARNAIKILANSFADISIDFGQPAFPTEVQSDKIMLVRFYLTTFQRHFLPETGNFVETLSTVDKARYYNGRPFIPLPPTTLTLDADGNIEILDVQITINKLLMRVRNKSLNTHYAIALASMKGYPIFETGEKMRIFDKNIKPERETEVVCSVFTTDNSTFNAVTERVFKAFEMLNGVNSVVVELSEFRPDIFAGGYVRLTLPDTSVANKMAFVKTVRHVFDAELWYTEIEANVIEPINYTVIEFEDVSPAEILPIIGDQHRVVDDE